MIIDGKRKRVPRSVFGTEDGAFLFEKEKKKKKKRRSKGTKDETCEWAAFERKISAQIAKAQASRFFIETYEQSDDRKIRPEKEIATAKARLRAAKREMGAVVKEIESLYSRVRVADVDDVDVEEVGCSKCEGFESTDANDILLCDRRGCFRAFHVECCGEIPDDDDDDDWFCPLCCCLQRCLDKINEDFDKDYTVGTIPFQEEVELPENASILDRDFSEDDDGDYEEHLSSSSDDRVSLSSACSGDDLRTLERDALPRKIIVDDVDEKNILRTKRHRAPIDYVVLNDAIQAEGVLFSDEDEDDDDWKK